MDKNDPRNPMVEKALFTKLSSLGNEEVDEIERLRKKFNVMEVKIDEIYNYLLASSITDPKEKLIDKINLVSAALLSVGLLLLLVGLLLPMYAMAFVSVAIIAVGLVLLFASIYLQSSRKGKEASRRAE